MAKIKDLKSFMRIVHRYLGYFMAGIMMVYALSGMLLVYRDTDFLKREKRYDKIIEQNLNEKKLARTLKFRQLEDVVIESDTLLFKQGFYALQSGQAVYTKMELPKVLARFVEIHKAKSGNRMAPLNVLFGVCLFFFVVSSFWMFPSKSKVFKKGMVYTIVGFVFALLVLFFWY